MKRTVLFTICLMSGVGLTHSALATSNKPFFPLSAECQEHCASKGERVDFMDSKMEGQCDCYPE